MVARYTNDEEIVPAYFPPSRLEHFAFVSLRLDSLVVRLLAACFALVNVLVLSLKAAALLLLGNDLLQDGLLAVLLVQTAAVELGGALDDGSDLGESRNAVLRVVLLVMTFGVQNVPHLKKL